MEEYIKTAKSDFLGIPLTSSQAVVGLYVLFILLILALVMLVVFSWHIRKIQKPKRLNGKSEEGRMLHDTL